MSVLKEKLAAIWASKAGKIVIAIIIIALVAFFSGGIGKIVGCVQQKAKTDVVEDKLDEAKKEIKDKDKVIDVLDKKLGKKEKK